MKNVNRTIILLFIGVGKDYEAMGDDGSSSKGDYTPKQKLLLLFIMTWTLSFQWDANFNQPCSGMVLKQVELISKFVHFSLHFFVFFFLAD